MTHSFRHVKPHQNGRLTNPCFLALVSAEQQLQPLLCHLLPTAGEGQGAPSPAAQPPVWSMEPETQEHLRLHTPRGESFS